MHLASEAGRAIRGVAYASIIDMPATTGNAGPDISRADRIYTRRRA